MFTFVVVVVLLVLGGHVWCEIVYSKRVECYVIYLHCILVCSVWLFVVLCGVL